MRHILVQTYCDWPECMTEWLEFHPDEEQPTKTVRFTVSSDNTRGRKQKNAPIELCEQHLNELLTLRKTLLKSADPKPRRKVRV